MIRDLLEDRINMLKTYIEKNKEDWKDFLNKRDSMDYDGAENYFGHADDCFDAGQELGEFLSAETELEFLQKLIKEMEK